jgi:outer membrane protein TolC
MRWKQVVAGLALSTAVLAGCKQQCFLLEPDYNHYKELIPQNIEYDPSVSQTPVTASIPVPPVTSDPDRPPRFLTLREAIALALENGTVGGQSINNPGFANDNLIAFAQRAVAGDDSIRVLSLDPAIVGTDIETSLAKFDAEWTTSLTWNSTDQPPNSLAAFQQQVGQSANLNTALLKPLPTGGVVGITFSTAYQNLEVAPQGIRIENPAYSPRLALQFEQPLLQGFGVEINQLRPAHPGSILSQLPNIGGTVEGILITRLRFDQERAEFERNVDFMLLNVETAYWNLYDNYWTLYSREIALRFAFESWRITKARFDLGRDNIQNLSQTRQQFESFRGQRLQAVGAVLEGERQLRTLVGLPRVDGKRLVPIDAPTLTPYKPDWDTAVNECLTLRPELILSRKDVEFRQLDLILQKNQLLPDLRFTSQYGLSGIGTRLDGPGDFNAFKSLAQDRFTDWTLGLRLTVPLGFRQAHAQVRVARLNLARSYRQLQDQEQKALGVLTLEYRHLDEFHQQVEIQRSQREAAAEQLGARFKEFLAGKGTLDILLESQRVFAEALRTEYDAITQYNNALVAFEFAKGTILQHDNVVIAEGGLPRMASERAVAHEEARTKALMLAQRPSPTAPCAACKATLGTAVITADGKGLLETDVSIPQLPANAASSLPAMGIGDTQKPLPVINEPWVAPAPAMASPTKSGQTAAPLNLPSGVTPTTPNRLPTLPDTDHGGLSAPTTNPSQPGSLPR